MNSLISDNGKYVGQYLHIRDSEFAIRMFAKFYNLANHNNNFLIDLNISKDLIHTARYYKNKIYVNKPGSDELELKSPMVGGYMVFIQETEKVYIFNKDEFNKFMTENKYHEDVSIIYVLGIDNGVEFKNMRAIAANKLETAKYIYMNRYNETEDPICIGIMNKDHLEILTDKYKFSVPLVM